MCKTNNERMVVDDDGYESEKRTDKVIEDYREVGKHMQGHLGPGNSSHFKKNGYENGALLDVKTGKEFSIMKRNFHESLNEGQLVRTTILGAHDMINETTIGGIMVTMNERVEEIVQILEDGFEKILKVAEPIHLRVLDDLHFMALNNDDLAQSNLTTNKFDEVILKEQIEGERELLDVGGPLPIVPLKKSCSWASRTDRDNNALNANCSLGAKKRSSIQKFQKKSDCAIKRNKKKRKKAERIEVVKASLSDSDLRSRWECQKGEAKKALDLGKKIGIKIIGEQEMPTSISYSNCFNRLLKLKAEAIPALMQDIVTWMAILDRLPTREKLIRMGITTEGSCTLCNDGLETRNHLFADCAMVDSLWNRILNLSLLTKPHMSWDNKLAWAISSSKGKSILTTIMKIAWCSFIYFVWEERNRRLFQGRVRTVDELLISIKEIVSTQLRNRELHRFPSKKLLLSRSDNIEFLMYKRKVKHILRMVGSQWLVEITCTSYAASAQSEVAMTPIKIHSKFSMNSPDFPMSRSPRKELQGPRPSPLKVRKDSYQIRKPPLAPQPVHHQQQPQQIRPPARHRHRHRQSNPPIFNDTSSGAISPAARFATIEKTKPPAEGKKQQIYEENYGFVEGIEMNRAVERTSFLPGILSPGPTSLPRISPNFFSPPSDPNSIGFFHDLSPVLHGNRNFIEGSFMPSPSSYNMSPYFIPSPFTPSIDLFNNFFDL
ncbi:PHD finger family protein [Hibiscus syriacus]|uniref:PHD finger family protein n=1 Tax=Hibiscus syriacus TaxID=106335 RepID=A0A6A3AFL3_HIBSY|nr:PHD finger family protein [Hibiscus syriacus]